LIHIPKILILGKGQEKIQIEKFKNPLKRLTIDGFRRTTGSTTGH